MFWIQFYPYQNKSLRPSMNQQQRITLNIRRLLHYFTTTHHKVDQANKYLQPIVILWYISDNFPMSCCWFNGEHMSYISKYQCIELAHCNNRGSQIKPHKYPIQVVNLPMIMMCNKLALCNVHASCLFNIEQYFKRLSCLHIN